jgi:hypothetical protein
VRGAWRPPAPLQLQSPYHIGHFLYHCRRHHQRCQRRPSVWHLDAGPLLLAYSSLQLNVVASGRRAGMLKCAAVTAASLQPSLLLEACQKVPGAEASLCRRCISSPANTLVLCATGLLGAMVGHRSAENSSMNTGHRSSAGRSPDSLALRTGPDLALAALPVHSAHICHRMPASHALYSRHDCVKYCSWSVSLTDSIFQDADRRTCSPRGTSSSELQERCTAQALPDIDRARRLIYIMCTRIASIYLQASGTGGDTDSAMEPYRGCAAALRACTRIVGSEAVAECCKCRARTSAADVSRVTDTCWRRP